MLMKLLSILPLLLLYHNSWCQDVITRRNGDTLSAKVLKVNPDIVEYKRPGGMDTGSLYMPVSEIMTITYQNGVKDSFNEAESHIYKGNYYGSMRLEERGKDDAQHYYKGYRSAKTAAIITSLFMPYGLVPVAVIASVKPRYNRYNNLDCPYPELMDKADYRMSYEKEAFRMKKKKTWGGFWIGAGIEVGVSVVIVGALALAYTGHW